MEDKKKGCTFRIPLISIAIAVGIVFTIMKLCGVVTWDWFYVCIPFIVAGALMLYAIILIIIVAIALIIQRKM
jgi:hypothetical protein